MGRLHVQNIKHGAPTSIIMYDLMMRIVSVVLEEPFPIPNQKLARILNPEWVIFVLIPFCFGFAHIPTTWSFIMFST